MSRLVHVREITPTRFGEVGRPYRIRRRDDGQVVALCSSFDLLYWPGRATYNGHTLRNRISLYAGDFERRVAVFDGAHFPINDVAFHPSEPWLAIGTGRYDGGYLFEGELLLWNWETGECRSLLAESREVAGCRFVDHERLAALLRPRDEEEYGEDDAFSTYVGVVLDNLSRSPQTASANGDPRLVDLQPIEPTSLGFDVRALAGHLAPEDHQHLATLGFEERHRVWDVAWLSPELVAAVHDGCHIEVWRLPDLREISLRGLGHGVQLLRQPDQMLVHVLERGNHISGQPDRSNLFALSGNSLIEWRQFANACAFSVDRHGRILARDTGDHMRSRARLDRVLDPSGSVVLETDLGHYDCFNHYVRLDGADALYFLRGTPPSSHQGKCLCEIDSDQTIHQRMTWDDQREHLMNGCAAFRSKDSIVRAYRVYNPSPKSTKGAIELFSLLEGRAVWKRDIDADVTSIVATADTRHIIFALTNGRLGVIDAVDGRLVHDELLAADGVPTIATALATLDQLVLIGTIDGRLMLHSFSTTA